MKDQKCRAKRALSIAMGWDINSLEEDFWIDKHFENKSASMNDILERENGIGRFMLEYDGEQYHDIWFSYTIEEIVDEFDKAMKSGMVTNPYYITAIYDLDGEDYEERVTLKKLLKE